MVAKIKMHSSYTLLASIGNSSEGGHNSPVFQIDNQEPINPRTLAAGSPFDNFAHRLRPGVINIQECVEIMSNNTDAVVSGKLGGGFGLWLEAYGLSSPGVTIKKDIFDQQVPYIGDGDIVFYATYKYYPTGQPIAYLGLLEIVDQSFQQRWSSMHLGDPVILFVPMSSVDSASPEPTNLSLVIAHFCQMEAPRFLRKNALIDMDNTMIIFNPSSSYGVFSILSFKMDPISIISRKLTLESANYRIERYYYHTHNNNNADRFNHFIQGKIFLGVVSYSTSIAIQNSPAQSVVIYNVRDLSILLNLIYPEQVQILHQIDPTAEINMVSGKTTLTIELDISTGEIRNVIGPLSISLRILNDTIITVCSTALLPEGFKALTHNKDVLLKSILPPHLITTQLDQVRCRKIILNPLSIGMYNLDFEIRDPLCISTSLQIHKTHISIVKTLETMNVNLKGEMFFGFDGYDQQVVITGKYDEQWNLETLPAAMKIKDCVRILPDGLKQLINTIQPNILEHVTRTILRLNFEHSILTMKTLFTLQKTEIELMYTSVSPQRLSLASLGSADLSSVLRGETLVFSDNKTSATMSI